MEEEEDLSNLGNAMLSKKKRNTITQYATSRNDVSLTIEYLGGKVSVHTRCHVTPVSYKRSTRYLKYLDVFHFIKRSSIENRNFVKNHWIRRKNTRLDVAAITH